MGVELINRSFFKNRSTTEEMSSTFNNPIIESNNSHSFAASTGTEPRQMKPISHVQIDSNAMLANVTHQQPRMMQEPTMMQQPTTMMAHAVPADESPKPMVAPDAYTQGGQGQQQQPGATMPAQHPMMAQPMMGQPQPSAPPMMGQPQHLTTPPMMGHPQPMAMGGAQAQGMPDLFSCFDDMNTCCCVYCCYFCAVGQTHERAGLKSGPTWKLPTMFCCGVLLSQCLVGILLQLLAMYWICEGRGEIQRLTGAPQAGDFCHNLFTVLFCTGCAACQEANAVNKMWEANGCRPLQNPGQALMVQQTMQMQMQPGMQMQMQPGTQMQMQPGMQMQMQPGMQMQAPMRTVVDMER